MPTWLAILIGAFVLLVIVLAIGGAYARKRQLERSSGRFAENLAEVNRELAAAHAGDRGWAREGLEAAARDAYATERPGAERVELTLVQIVDMPGTDDDKAVFDVRSGDRSERLRLGRAGGEWRLEELG